MTKSITFRFDNPESLNDDGTFDVEKGRENLTYQRYEYAAGIFEQLGFSTGLGANTFTIVATDDKDQSLSFDVDQTEKGSKLVRFEITDGEFPHYQNLVNVFSANGFGNQLSQEYFLLIIDGDDYDKVDLMTENS